MRRIVLAVFIVSLAGTAWAGDVLPLEHGYYVAAGTPCRAASSATITRYDGAPIGEAEALNCRLDNVSRKGDTYTFVTTCTDLNNGAPQTDTTNVTIRSKTAYVLKNSLGTFPARLCPRAALPEPWRSNAVP